MTYAVTAVSGQLGRAIAETLIALPGSTPVIGLARTPGKVTDFGIEVRPGDHDQRKKLQTSLAGIDALVIVSGMAPPEDRYQSRGEIANSAGSGKCGYTTRPELAHAYAALLTRDDLNGGTYDLNGTPITQAELAGYLNHIFGTDLTYREMTPEAFVADRSAELADFFGPIIGGIYEGIRQGVYDRPGDYAEVAGRPHQSWEDYFSTLRA